ncbi:MAG: hypothetical protein ACRCXT_23070 [Paraclostridium sp.]
MARYTINRNYEDNYSEKQLFIKSELKRLKFYILLIILNKSIDI